MCRLYVALARALEEESDYKDLQGPHADDQPYLDHAKVDNAPLCALHRRKVTVLARAEVLLVSADGGELAGDLEDGLLEDGGLLGGRSLLGGELGAGFILDGDLEVDELLGEGTHFVVEAERVVTRLLRCKDKVSLSLLLARENDLAVRALNLVIDIERTAGLHLDHPN